MDGSIQKRGYVFQVSEWWCRVTVDGTDVSHAAVRVCPREGWVDVYVLDVKGRVMIAGQQMLVARIRGRVTVTNARRHGGISELAAVDG